MAPDLWIAFVLASVSLLVLPGPTVFMVFAVALVHGRRATWIIVPAVTLGGALTLALSMLGLGGLLQTWPRLGVVLQFCGAAYLAYFALELWRSADAPPEPEQSAPRHLFWSLFAVTTLNPKGLIFFLAFIPQFLSHDIPFFQQSIVMAVTYLALVVVVFFGYALLAGSLAERGMLRQAPWMSRAAALVLLASAGGAALAF
jgi:threonine/homoserine/homoserine lactone efflux protein